MEDIPRLSSLACALRAYKRRMRVPSRTLTSNLEFRTLPLCALSYGHEGSEPLAGLFHQLTPSTFKIRIQVMKGLGRSSYFAFRGSKWYARPVTLRIQALI